MLVLSRKIGQEIVIGDDIVVKITCIQGGRVRIGVEAPKSVSITRSEIEPVRETAAVSEEQPRQFAAANCSTALS